MKNNPGQLKPLLWMVFLLVCLASCHIRHKLPSSPDSSMESDKKLLEKYEQSVGIRLGSESIGLYRFVDAWMGTPYGYGECSRRMTDCSCFSCTLYKEVYKKEIPRSSEDQLEKSEAVHRNRLKEGDLVFFRIEEGKKTSHVGVYLGNHRFVHASSSKGVRIDDLESKYYTETFVRGGRF